MHSLAYAPTGSAPALCALPDPSDAHVVHEVMRGNREMFEVIVRRYNQQLYRIGMAYLRDHAQAEDAMQSAYLKAFLNLGKFRGTSSFGTWLTRIMINECLMALRANRRFKLESIHGLERQAEHEALVAPGTEMMFNQDMKAVLEKAIQALPRTHRAVYLLREVQQLSTTETAQCLGLSRANVKVCLHRAREELKTELMKSAAGVELFSYPARYCAPLTARVMELVRAARFAGGA